MLLRLCGSFYTMPPAKRSKKADSQKADFMSLPEDLWCNIGYRLSERDMSSMELASKKILDALLRPSRDAPYERWLFLGVKFGRKAPSPEGYRWLQKRILRYSNIVCDFSNNLLDGTLDPDARAATYAVPPLLPSLLAACAPSAELSLNVRPYEGARLLAMASGSIAPGATPALCSFAANLKQHLTKLTCWLFTEEFQGEHLEAVGLLTALRELRVGRALRYRATDDTYPETYHDMDGTKLDWKLPELTYLHMHQIMAGEIVLSCPKLAQARFEHTHSLSITVEDAALEDLALADCQEIQFAWKSLEMQLQHLVSLRVFNTYEKGRSLIQDVSHMVRLQVLHHGRLPAACIPACFPRSLRQVELSPVSWIGEEIPEGLRGVPELETCILAEKDSWQIAASMHCRASSQGRP